MEKIQNVFQGLTSLFWDLGFCLTTGWARLNRSLSSVRFYFELSGNSNYIIHCKSNYVQNFELEINSI